MEDGHCGNQDRFRGGLIQRQFSQIRVVIPLNIGQKMKVPSVIVVHSLSICETCIFCNVFSWVFYAVVGGTSFSGLYPLFLQLPVQSWFNSFLINSNILKYIDVFASLEVYVYVLIVLFERKKFFKCITNNGTLSEHDN